MDIREESFKDVYNMKPSWWMKWSITIVFIIISILLILGYMISYPDVVKSEFRLTTNKPSIVLPAKTKRQIKNIFISNNDKVKLNDHLILFENDSRYNDVILLENELKSFSLDRDTIIEFTDRFLNKNLQLGSSIENDWIDFSTELLGYYKIEKLKSYEDQVTFINNELSKQYQLRAHYAKLIKIDKKQELLIDDKIKTDSVLYVKGILSRTNLSTNRQHYLESKKTLQQNELALKRIDLEIIKLKNGASSYNKDEIQNILSRKAGIQRTLNRLLTSVEVWKQKNILIAPVSGEVNFLKDIKEGAYYEGDILIVSPLEKEYYASMKIPFAGAGKVKELQRTILKLSDYPYREYGFIEGTLATLSPIAGDNFYLGKVVFKKESISSYGNQIILRENMSGIGEIITNDRNILERLFEKVIYALKT
jgi:hypothetical protein